MIDTLLDILTWLVGYIKFLFGVGTSFIVGGVVGWLLAAFRRSKSGGQGATRLEAALDALKSQVAKVGQEADKLYKKVGWPVQFSAADVVVKAQTYREPGRPGRLGRLIDRLRRYFRAEESEEGGGDAATPEQRVTEIKLQVEDVKMMLRNVEPRLMAAPRESDISRSESAQKQATPPPDTGGDVKDMEWFSQRHPQQDSTPNSISIDHSYYERSRSSERQFDSGRQSDRGLQPTSGVGAEIVEMYNRAVNDPFERERFRDRYTPVRVGTVNAVERRQNPTIAAEYREASDGDFFAYSVGGDEYVVVPSLGLTIEAVRYTAGALGEVFRDTQGHDPQHFYSNYRVLRPAIFRRVGDRWNVLSQGALDLGPGD